MQFVEFFTDPVGTIKGAGSNVPNVPLNIPTNSNTKAVPLVFFQENLARLGSGPSDPSPKLANVTNTNIFNTYTTDIKNFYNTYNSYTLSTVDLTPINKSLESINTKFDNFGSNITNQINALELQNGLLFGKISDFGSNLGSTNQSISNVFDLMGNQTLNSNIKFNQIDNRLSNIESSLSGFSGLSNDLSKFSTKLDEIPALLKSYNQTMTNDILNVSNNVNQLNNNIQVIEKQTNQNTTNILEIISNQNSFMKATQSNFDNLQSSLNSFNVRYTNDISNITGAIQQQNNYLAQGFDQVNKNIQVLQNQIELYKPVQSYMQGSGGSHIGYDNYFTGISNTSRLISLTT